MSPLASQAVPSPRADAAAEAPLSAVPRVGVGAGILAVAVPFLFLHESYQPNLSLEAGDIDASLADAAILAIVVAAIVVGRHEGFGPLVPSKRLLVAVAALCALCLAWVFLPVLRDQPYEWRTKLVAAAGFAEYALLVPALPLLLRNHRERRLFVTVLVAISVAATAWAILQFAGLVDELRGRRPAQREPSFVGSRDFSGPLGVRPGGRPDGDGHPRTARRASVGDRCGYRRGLGTALAGAMTGVLGLWLAAGLLAAVGVVRYGAGKRQLLALLAIVLAVGAGAAATRGDAIEGFAEFLGINKVDTPGQVESYAQRTLLGYIGLRIFLDHPLIGSGFQASNDEFAFGPHLDAARDRFPGQPAIAFPSPEHPWGVQNLPIAALADFGVVGLALFLVVFGLGLQLGLRRTPTTIQLLGACWILVVAGVWNGLGVVPAIPLAALTWLGCGLAALDD